MRFWPFSRPEVREAPYTDAVVAAIIASGNKDDSTLDPSETGAAAVAAAVVARAFASAEVEGIDISPSLLGDIGRDLTLRGESVLIRYDGVVLRAVQWEVLGKAPVPSLWAYKVHLPTPGGDLKTERTGALVAHPRFAPDPNRPWVGVGPFQRAPRLMKLLGRLERALSNELSGPVGYVLPLPTDGNDDSIAELKNDIGKMAGDVAVVETTASGWGEGRQGAPTADWRPQRIGPNPPASLGDLFRTTELTVLALGGVPIELVVASDGTGQREAWRRFLHGTLEPLARIVAPELGKLAGRPVRFDFSALFASDIAGRARAFGSMVQGGMDIAAAASASGILSD